MNVRLGLAILCLWLSASGWAAGGIIVLQTDFGEKDGAVAAMRGVAYSVSAALKVEDLTHEIPAFDIWQAAYRLKQTAPYWPAGTVFVSVVDPGVGTPRKSVVAFANSQYFVTPDNGTLSLVAEEFGIDEVREIDEAVNRRAGSEHSHTFHGRDVYVYTGARLAASTIAFDKVGPALSPDKLVRISAPEPTVSNGVINGFIPVLDPQYGNVWTNVPLSLVRGVHHGTVMSVTISKGGDVRYQASVPYERTFGEVGEGEPLLYINSLGNVAIALNQGNFAAAHDIASGPEWTIELSVVE